MIAAGFVILDQGGESLWTEADGSYWANRVREIKLVCICTHFFANSKSTSRDFKVSSVLLPDAFNEKFFIFLAVGLMHSACPATVCALHS